MKQRRTKKSRKQRIRDAFGVLGTLLVIDIGVIFNGIIFFLTVKHDYFTLACIVTAIVVIVSLVYLDYAFTGDD